MDGKMACFSRFTENKGEIQLERSTSQQFHISEKVMKVFE